MRHPGLQPSQAARAKGFFLGHHDNGWMARSAGQLIPPYLKVGKAHSNPVTIKRATFLRIHLTDESTESVSG